MHAVIETSAFSRSADALLPRGDRAELVDILALDPLAGDVMLGLGGVRKLRIAPKGRSGGGNEAEHSMNKDTEFGHDLITSMQEASGILRGELEPGRVHLPPGAIDVRAIRTRLGLSRPAFAERFGLAVSAVRDWEQGLRRPDPAARVLLMVIARSPEVVAETVAEARAA